MQPVMLSATVLNVESFFRDVEKAAAASKVFGEVTRSEHQLSCAAADSAEPAWYRVELSPAGDACHVSLVTANRWLSESIEADLMHTGDPIEELIEEELAELDYAGPPLSVQHYRSDDMLYTFRSPVSLQGLSPAEAVQRVTQCLLAYEAAFRELGDMNAGSGQDD